MPITLGKLLGIIGAQTVLYIWVIKQWIKWRFEREADKKRAALKLEGDAQIERLRNSLQLVAYEQQIRFSKLHERRADIIAHLYKLLNEVPAIAGQFVIMSPSDPAQEKMAKEKVVELYFFIEDNRIYFPSHVCVLLDNFSAKLQKSVVYVSVYWKVESANENTRKEQRKVMLDAVQALETEIPALKKEIEGEFRKMLGEPVTESRDLFPTTQAPGNRVAK